MSAGVKIGESENVGLYNYLKSPIWMKLPCGHQNVSIAFVGSFCQTEVTWTFWIFYNWQSRRWKDFELAGEDKLRWRKEWETQTEETYWLGGGGARGAGGGGKDGQNKLSSVQTGPPTLSKLSQLSLLCFPLDIPFHSVFIYLSSPLVFTSQRNTSSNVHISLINYFCWDFGIRTESDVMIRCQK